jgi:predicted Zn-dependent protease
VAAVLAHEIGHVQEKHGLQAIKKSRITSALTIIGMESAKQLGGQELSDLTRIFEKSISDITATLVNNGYSRSFERAADRSAITILQRVGYNPSALVDMLEVMGKRLEPGGPDFARTHPSPTSRISDIRNMADITRRLEPPRSRESRFHAALGDI